MSIQLSAISIKIAKNIPPAIRDLAFLGLIDLDSAVELEDYIMQLIKIYTQLSEDNTKDFQQQNADEGLTLEQKLPEICNELIELLYN